MLDTLELEKMYNEASLGKEAPTCMVSSLSVLREASKVEPRDEIQAFLRATNDLPGDVLVYITRNNVGLL